jgi:hypothetical protein
MAAQLVLRRVFTDKGELIREDLAPKDIPNTRKDLMAWWEAEDKRKAAEEAAAAEAEAARLAAPPEPTAEDRIFALSDRLEALQSELIVMRERLKVVDQLELASPESIAACAMAAAMAAGSAEATITAGKKAREDIQGVADAATERLDSLEGQLGEASKALGQLLADVRSDFDRNEAQRTATMLSWISKRVAGFEIQVAAMRGPRGMQGPAGSGTCYGKGEPPEKHPTGRDWFVGEGYINYKRVDTLPLYVRLASGGWDTPVPTKQGDRLINATSNVLDMAPRSTNIITTVKSGGSGGSGGEKLLDNRISLNSELAVGDTSNWAGISDPLSGTIELDIRALDGSYAGQSSVCIASFTWEASDDKWTEYALNGSLFDKFTINLRIQRSPAVAPAAYTGVLPPGASRIVVLAKPVLVTGAADGGTTRFSLAGSVEYNHEAKKIVQMPNATPIEPLWHWG